MIVSSCYDKHTNKICTRTFTTLYRGCSIKMTVRPTKERNILLCDIETQLDLWNFVFDHHFPSTLITKHKQELDACEDFMNSKKESLLKHFPMISFYANLAIDLSALKRNSMSWNKKNDIKLANQDVVAMVVTSEWELIAYAYHADGNKHAEILCLEKHHKSLKEDKKMLETL